MANREVTRERVEVGTHPPPHPVKCVPKMVALTEPDARGVLHRMGETHHHAILSDAEVDQLRDEYEAGVMGYRTLAKKWNVSKRTVRDIVNYNRRNTWAAKWKRQEG